MCAEGTKALRIPFRSLGGLSHHGQRGLQASRCTSRPWCLAPDGDGSESSLGTYSRPVDTQWKEAHFSFNLAVLRGCFLLHDKKKKKKNETDFCFLFFSLGKGLLFIDTDTGFETPATTKRVFIRAEKNKSQKKAECGVLQRLKTSDGGELGCQRTGTSVFSGSS